MSNKFKDLIIIIIIVTVSLLAGLYALAAVAELGEGSSVDSGYGGSFGGSGYGGSFDEESFNEWAEREIKESQARQAAHLQAAANSLARTALDTGLSSVVELPGQPICSGCTTTYGPGAGYAAIYVKDEDIGLGVVALDPDHGAVEVATREGGNIIDVDPTKPQPTACSASGPAARQKKMSRCPSKPFAGEKSFRGSSTGFSIARWDLCANAMPLAHIEIIHVSHLDASEKFYDFVMPHVGFNQEVSGIACSHWLYRPEYYASTPKIRNSVFLKS